MIYKIITLGQITLEKSSKMSNTQLFPLFVWNTVPQGASNCRVPSNTKLYVRVPSAITSLSLETLPSCVEVQFLIKCVGVSRPYSLTSLSSEKL